jgi:hypothetical protein
MLRRRYQLALCFFAFLAAAPSGRAAETTAIGVGVQAGRSSVTGSLADTNDAATRGVEVLVGRNPHDSESRFHTMFSAPMTFVDFHRTKSDSFFQEERLTAERTGFVPNVCVRAIWEISGCAGIGYEIIRVQDQSGKNRRSYGDIGYQARIGRFTGSGLIAGVLMDSFAIEETHDGVTSKASFRPITALVGGQFSVNAKD